MRKYCILYPYRGKFRNRPTCFFERLAVHSSHENDSRFAQRTVTIVPSFWQRRVSESSSNRISLNPCGRCRETAIARCQTDPRGVSGWSPRICHRSFPWLLVQSVCLDEWLLVVLISEDSGVFSWIRVSDYSRCSGQRPLSNIQVRFVGMYYVVGLVGT